MRKYLLAIISLIGIALLAGIPTVAPAEGISTRFGTLQIGGELGDVLSFKGRRVLRGGNPLSVIKTFRMRGRDVALVQETGGTACPALYYFVTLRPHRVQVTRAFGTCVELTKYVRKGDRILVFLPGYRGPFEAAADRKKAAGERHIFTYHNGLVTEKGKPVR